jgi:hypothetical protein
MLAGDVCYIALMTACLAAAQLLQPRALEERVRRD